MNKQIAALNLLINLLIVLSDKSSRGKGVITFYSITLLSITLRSIGGDLDGIKTRLGLDQDI